MIDFETDNQDSKPVRTVFESFGVTVSLETNSKELMTEIVHFLNRSLAGNMNHLSPSDPARFSFSVECNRDSSFEYYQDGNHIRHIASKNLLLRELSSGVRIKVAEFASDRLFVHAGVVRWNGKGIMFPGNSQMGKTTLVAELISHGAEYYSDEYAVFDEDGLCHPFTRPLSVRTQTELLQVTPSDLGAVIGEGPMPIDVVLFTSYEPEAVWAPRCLSTGNGIIETIPHAISMTSNADFALKLLKSGLTRAIMLKGMRCDAKKFAPVLIKFIEDLYDRD